MLIRDRLPAYITWGRFRSNQDRLAANRSRCGSPGAPRQGPSLLAGLLRCGRRMIVRDSGAKGRHCYGCTRGSADYAEPLCQCLSGPVVDDLVRGQILAAVGEDKQLEADVFEELDDDHQDEFLRERSDEQVAEVLSRMASDDVADLLLEIQQDRRVAVLNLLPAAKQRKVMRLLGYNPSTAGGLMNRYPHGTPTGLVIACAAAGSCNRPSGS